MTTSQTIAPGPMRRAQVEAALADYPHISEDRLAALIGWFRNEASALDVATVASNERIADPYRRFRADHIDSFKGKDVMKVMIALSVVAAIILFIAWRAI